MELKLIGIEDLMAMLGCSRKYATRLFQEETFPTLPRIKGEPYRAPYGAVVEWLNGKRGK